MKIQFYYLWNKTCCILLILIFIHPTSNAQIIYTDLIPDSVVNVNGGNYQLDLNNDGTIDFTLNLSKSTVSGTHCSGTRTRYGVTVTPASTSLNAVANISYAGVNFPPPIFSDSIINDSNFVWISTSGQNLVNESWTCTGTKPRYMWHATITGKWNGATDKFLGLKFNSGGNSYFGWVRLTISGASIRINDYAYNSVPEQLIYAGQSTTEFLTVSPITNSPFCAGDSLNIGFTVYGNFDSTNVFTAQLSDSAGSFVNPISIGSISSRVSGTINATIPAGTVYGLLYHVRVIASNPNGISNFNNANLIINTTLPLNHLTTINTSGICVGDSARLQAPVQTGYSYQWSLNNTNINNASLYYFYGDTSGSYRCIISNGCGSILSDSIEIILHPLPLVDVTTSGALWICPGESVVLYAIASQNCTYAWYHNNSISTTQPNDTVHYAAICYVEITDSLGCSNSSSPDTIAISNPYVNIVAGGQLSFCLGDSVFLRQTSVTDTCFIFQWYRNNIIIPGATSNYFYAKLTGAYTIRITNPYGNCISTSNIINAVAGCTGLEIINSETHFTINTNLSDNILKIISGSVIPANVQIINQLGQIVYFGKINSSPMIIDVSNFSEGIYIIKWVEEGYSESKQFSVVN